MVYWVWLVFEAQFYHFQPSPFIPRLKSWAFWGTDRKQLSTLYLEKLEKFFILDEELVLMSVSIKDVDKNTYRNLRAEATRHGMRVGDAATEAFRLWVSSKRQDKQRDEERMRHAAEDMDNLRKTSDANWSGAEEIRRWRDERRR